MKNKIIELIKRNRISTTEVADCLGKKGLFKNAFPLNKSHFKVGVIHYTFIDSQSNWNMHKDIQNVSENSIVLVDDLGTHGRASFGELVSKYLLLYRQSAGIITNTKVRDAHSLVKENYPIWCRGTNPIGCFNTKPLKQIDSKVIRKRRDKFDGAVAVCDDSGVIIIKKKFLNETFFNKLVEMENLEDKWFDCMDRLKMNTFDIVCKKKYKE